MIWKQFKNTGLGRVIKKGNIKWQMYNGNSVKKKYRFRKRGKKECNKSRKKNIKKMYNKETA